MKVKGAWKYKFIACMTAVAMVFSSFSIPAVSVYADENDAAVEMTTEDIAPEEAVTEETEEAATPETDADEEVEETEEAAIVPVGEAEEAAVADDTVAAEDEEDEAAPAEEEAAEDDTAAAGLAEEDISVAGDDGATTLDSSHVCSLKKVGDSRLYYYNTLQAAVNAVAGEAQVAAKTVSKDNVITLLKDTEQNVRIYGAVTFDLGGHVLKAIQEDGQDEPYGPIYLKNNAVDGIDNTVYVKNGTVIAEIDGESGFWRYEDDPDKQNEIKYTGPVVLDGITLEPYRNSNGTIIVHARLWTDGHPYTLIDCTFTGDAQINNINSKVTIKSGTYGEKGSPDKCLVFYGNTSAEDIEKYGVHHEEREFFLDGGEYNQEDIDQFITDDHKKVDQKDNDKTPHYRVEEVDKNTPEIPNRTEKVCETGHSITIQAESQPKAVQYTLDKDNGPWYSINGDGQLVKTENDGKVTVLPDGKDAGNGVFMTGDGHITFTKDFGTELAKDKYYDVYSRYPEQADNPVNIRTTPLSTGKVDAADIAKVFNKKKQEQGDITTEQAEVPDGNTPAAENANVSVSLSEDASHYIIKVKQNINEPAPIEIPDNWGNQTLDLNGKEIRGANGASVADPNGKDAIQMVQATAPGKPTNLAIEDNSDGKNGLIKGGDAFAGTGGNGGDGIDIADEADATISVGEDVKILGGNGADTPADSDKNGGNGGAGVDGDVTSNAGTIQGGSGGKANGTGNGGAGGDGVEGKVDDNSGKIAGGKGGDSANGAGGAGGAGVDGDVPTNSGVIEGGNGGNSTGNNGDNGGAGGDGVTGNVTDNKPSGAISGGNGGDSKNKDGGAGGDGVDKNIAKNEGDITGGKGGNATGGSGNGGTGGNGVTGNVTDDNTGDIKGGDGGNSAGGNGGAGGDGVDKDVAKNEGDITGGKGGNATGGTGAGGAGGAGVDGKVTDNTPSGNITGGNGGSSAGGTGGTGGDGVDNDVTKNDGNIKGGNGGNSAGSNGGTGGNGVDGNVATNNGNISGGNGGSATGKTGNGGDGGKGVTGSVGNGTGKVSGGNGGSSKGGKGGAGGIATGGNNGNGGNGGDDPTAGMTKEEAELYKKSEPLETVESALKTLNADKGDLPGSDFAVFRLRAHARDKAIKLTWKKQAGADGYIIYGNLCGKQYPMSKKVKEIKNGKTTRYTVKNLKKGRYYRYTVVAYKKFGNKKRVLATAIIVHSTTNGGNRTNPTAIVLKSKNSMTVGVGKTQNIKATYKKKGNKRVSRHISIVRFESSNPAVATVDRAGKVKGIAPGRATIYIYGQNGVYKTVKVTVK